MKVPAKDVGFRQSLLQLLEAEPAREEGLLDDFDRRGGDGQPLYSSVLSILTHLDFSEPRAQRHWRRIRAHRQALRTVLGRDVGLRVAILDYFVNVNHELKNPKVIEISAFERTARSAATDALTGLYNHGFFLQALRREILRARRHDLLLSLVMVDLDDFKNINDTRGHLEGDRVLVRAAALLGESLREIDIAARYGGEEFAIILPETSRTGAAVVADRIRRRVAADFGRRRSGPAVTLSAGVAGYPEDAGTAEELIRRADEALYRAKADGKNRVTLVGRERRHHRRVPIRQPLTIAPAGARARRAVLCNVSEDGLLVSLRQALPLGSQVGLTMRPPGAPALSLRGEVVRVTPATTSPASRYDVGVRLVGERAALRRIVPADGRAARSW
ncbi:MAG TPA: diguanylate cyclase [Vicinamibacteria bacterium]|nr:diguanylate cyclase [Vicinamibacteria bacterium]